MFRKGFTLIELMIVVVIIGILSAIAIPKFTAVKEQANEVSYRSNLRSLGSAEAMYYCYHNVYGSIASLVQDLDGNTMMENADILECPTARVGYAAFTTVGADTYEIDCPAAGSLHGSIVDGILSW